MKRSFEVTHKFVKRLADLVTYGRIAKVCGKEMKTAESWGRAPESNAEPLGTGKKNPLDCVQRLIALAFEKSPGLAREMAEIFIDYVDYLENKQFDEETVPVGELLKRSVKEHTDVVLKLLNSPDPDWAAVHTEIVQSRLAMKHPEMHVKGQLAPKI